MSWYMEMQTVKVPAKSPALKSFYDLLSPTPSTCSVESTEALLRDLVDVYSEPIVVSPSSGSDRSRVSDCYCDESTFPTFTDSHQQSVRADEPFFSPEVDEFLSSVKQEIHNDPQRLRPNAYQTTNASPCVTPVQPQFPPSLPQFHNYPTGGPPYTPEPSLLSDLSTRSQSLHRALRAECQPNLVPLSLIQAVTSSDTHIPAPLPLTTRSEILQKKLSILESTHKLKADQLHLFYQLEAARIESDRTNHLCASIPTPSALPAVNKYFNTQYHALIDNIELQIHCLQYQFTPRNPTCSSQKITDQSIRVSPADIKLNSHYKRQKKTKPPPLNKLAIKIMKNWYDRNVENAYPSHESAEIMAKAGNVTAEQVKKWFANKRMRNANTKPQRAAAKATTRPADDDSIYRQPLKRIRIC